MKIGNNQTKEELLQAILLLNYSLFGNLIITESNGYDKEVTEIKKKDVNSVRYLLKEAQELYFNKLYAECEDKAINK
jgi:hypothetical protein